jgi:hypothetical protein
MRAGLIILAALLVGGCHEPTGPKTISNPDLSVKVPAIKQAVADHDMSSAGELVKELNDDDPAVRLYAIEGLQRLSGEDFGYRYYNDKEDRVPAIAKWQKWLEAQKH